MASDGYTRISELQFETVVNVMGVIRHSKAGQRSRRGEYMWMFSITDQPQSSGPEPLLHVNYFRKHQKQIPTMPLLTGCIVRIHNLKVQDYKGKPQGLCTANTLTTIIDARSKFTIIFQDTDNPDDMTPADWKRCKHLAGQPSAIAIPNTTPLRTVSEMQDRQFSKLVCQVVDNGEPNVEGIDKLEAHSGSSDPSLEGGKYRLDPLEVLPLSAWDKHAEVCGQAEAGSYLFLEGVLIYSRAGAAELVLRGSDINYAHILPSGHDLLKGLKMRKKERLRQDVNPPTTSEEATAMPPPRPPAVDPTPPPVPNKYVISVRLRGIFPSSVYDLSLPVCKCCQIPFSAQDARDTTCCPACGDDIPDTSYTYRFALQVEDKNKDRLVVIVCGPHAAQFLRNLPPTNFRKHDAAAVQVQNRLLRLVGVNDVSDSQQCVQGSINELMAATHSHEPVWFDLSIMSYHHVGGKSPFVLYQVFDSVLLGQEE
ncbi:3-ketoacyl-CoA thiolase with broad chain length specificity [Sorochytrium milnesiophthora]